MKNLHYNLVVLPLLIVALLAPAGAGAASNSPASPELAVKREMVRKQQEQRITPEKRKAAAEALKAERLRVYKAKQAVKKAPPSSDESK
jgi:hypothetical protein